MKPSQPRRHAERLQRTEAAHDDRQRADAGASSVRQPRPGVARPQEQQTRRTAEGGAVAPPGGVGVG